MIKRIQGPEKHRGRVIIIVLDGAGAGALPDADLYGDSGASTLVNVIKKHGPLKIPNLYSLGLEKILGIGEPGQYDLDLSRFYGRMQPQSPGKDTTSGHWELAGLVMNEPFPLYPHGFPEQIIDAFEKAIGRPTLGNLAASGTEIIKELGPEHLETGYPIVYTSADSVFQIAAHEDIVPPDLLYQWCREARALLTGSHAVGRVIARPFIGTPGAFRRTAGRHDFSLEPPDETLLDRAKTEGYPVAVIGKVSDIFVHRGITEKLEGGNNDAIAADLMTLINQNDQGLIWATFGDFDTVYGHRNDSKGFARALEEFDLRLKEFMDALSENDLLFITADHGCDPTFPTTDHTREYVPLIAWNEKFPPAVNLGVRNSFADLGATAACWLDLKPLVQGTSFITR